MEIQVKYGNYMCCLLLVGMAIGWEWLLAGPGGSYCTKTSTLICSMNIMKFWFIKVGHFLCASLFGLVSRAWKDLFEKLS